MVKYKKEWEQITKELEDLRSRMITRSLTTASIATCREEIDEGDFDELRDKLTCEFYNETKNYAILFEWLVGNSISIIGPEGAISEAEDFFRVRGWEIDQASLIVLKGRRK